MRFHLLLAACLGLTACADGFTTFPVSEPGQEQLQREDVAKDSVQDIRIVRLSESNIAQYEKPRRGPERAGVTSSQAWQYRVGPGDVLSVTVFGHPDLNLPAGPQAGAAAPGFTVQADGTFNYPFIGAVMANNRGVPEIRSEVAQRLAEYIPDPQVEIRVSEFNSQSVIISGEVNQANTQPLTTVRLTLLGALNAAGGLTEAADPKRISLQRGGRIAHIDLTGFLEKGYPENNPVLRNGDIVNVPRRQVLEAFLLGEVVQPAAVDLSDETVTLTQAITRQGGLTEVRADARGIFVFREEPEGMSVYQLDTSSPAGLLLGTRFVLEPGDVVYVTRSPLQRWNDTITRILPTVQAASAVNGLRNN